MALPDTTAQRRAVALLREHGRVYISGRGRWSEVGVIEPNTVSPQMSAWLQRNGYARWNAPHYSALELIHRDTHQTYDVKTDPLNSFVTHCTCGHTTRGMDPNDADAEMLAHTNPEN